MTQFISDVWNGYRKDVNRLHTAFSDQSVGHKQNMFQRGLNYAFAEGVGIPYAIVDAATGHSSDKYERQQIEKSRVVDKRAPLNKVKKKSKQEIRDMSGRKKFGPKVSMKLAKKRLMARKKKKGNSTMPVSAKLSFLPSGRSMKSGNAFGRRKHLKMPYQQMPLSYMQGLNCGPSHTVRAGSKPGSVIITVRRRIANVVHATHLSNYGGTAAIGVGPAFALDSATEYKASVNNDTCIPFNPSLAMYWPTPLNTLADNFNLHRCLSCKFDYTTDQVTSFAYRIFLAYTKDPDYMEKVGAGSATGVSNIKWSTTNLVALPNCVSFPFWQNKSFVVPLDRGKKYWNIPTSLSTLIGPGGLYPFGLAGATAVSRQEFQGMLYIGGDIIGTTSITDQTGLGELFMTSTWELSDLAGYQSVAAPTLIQTLNTMGVSMPAIPDQFKKEKRRGPRHVEKLIVFDEDETPEQNVKVKELISEISEHPELASTNYNFSEEEIKHGKFETTDSLDKLTGHIENLLSLQEQLKETKTKISDVSEKKDITILAKEARELLKRFKSGDLNSHEASKIALDDSPILIEPNTLPLK